MTQFTPILKRINERLDLPQPTKSRIILEIASDLEDTFRFYLQKGLDEQESFQKAEEKFDLYSYQSGFEIFQISTIFRNTLFCFFQLILLYLA